MISGFKQVAGITGLSLGLGIGGTAIKGINTEIGESIISGGQAASNFISPAVNISMGGTIIKMLKGIK